jgi:hypothetical protein
MSQKTSAFEPPDRRLERHAAASIDEDTDLLTVVQAFDLRTAEVYEAGETEWNARYGYEPMVRRSTAKNSPGSRPKNFTSISPRPSVLSDQRNFWTSGRNVSIQSTAKLSRWLKRRNVSVRYSLKCSLSS